MSTAEEYEAGKETDELWRLAILVEDAKLDSSFQDLRAHPMRLLAWFSSPRPRSDNAALAMCKLSLLDTFDNVHEYQAKKGVQLRSASSQRCRYPHVTLAPYHNMDSESEMVLMNLDFQSQSLEQHTGLTRPTTPTLLVASQAFLASHGYFHMELVWVHPFSPLPLDRVILSAAPARGSVPLTPALVEQAMQHLSSSVESGTVLLRQDTTFSLPGLFSLAGSGEKRHDTAKFTVLECSPVLQGKITRDTEVAVVPQEEGGEGEEEEEAEEEEVPAAPSPLSRSRKSHIFSTSMTSSTSSDLYQSSVEESFESKPRSGSVLSNCSASDFRNEDELPTDPCLEVATHPGIKLHRHYVLLPKTFAVGCELSQYQTVLLVAEKTHHERALGLVDVVVSIRPRGEGEGAVEGSHGAIVLWYDGQSELESYLPPPYPGYRYEEDALQVAYVHPLLMYSLFHETLSPTRRYLISVKVLKSRGEAGEVCDFPRAKVVTLAPVGVAEPLPELKTEQTQTALREYFQQRTRLAVVGDIFKVDFESAGTVHYRILDMFPEGSKKIDSSLREISWQTRTVNYPLPSEAPPFPFLPPSPYFSRLLPPGLEEPCLSLFSLLLPLLQSDPRARPSRSPAILVSGPGGVGKAAVVRAVARRLRAHLLELNCYNYCSDSVAVVEKRFSLDVARAFHCTPCVVLLRNVHMLGRDNKRDEPRLAAAFHSYMHYVSEYNSRGSVDFPVLVVATSSKPGSIPAQVAMELLHTVELAPPTETQRLAMLQGLASDHLTAPGIAWTQLARQTAGFLLGDLVSLFSRAGHIATSSAIQHYESCCGAVPSSARLAMSGVAISPSHIDQALAVLHSAHSDAIGAPKIPCVRWEDVGGLAEAKQEVLDAIQLPLAHPDLFAGGLRRSGVLLYGPPGTGKTLLAKAVATECGVHFLSVKGPELINMYVGQTEENVREIFTRARGAAPCIIFFDELDSIAPNRGKTGDSGGVMDRVVSQLLAELDGLQKSSDVFVIGATNRPDLLDAALLRPGRFDRLVYLGISEDVESRVKILRAITRKFTLASDVDLHDLAARCPANLTGADLYALCSEALLVALRLTIQRLEGVGRGGEGKGRRGEEAETLEVTRQDFLSAMSQLTPSVSQAELERYQDLRQTATTS